jgi:predicted DNA binding CopG/RHH family protein
MIVTQIPEDLYREVKTRLAEKGQTMDSYIKSLVSEDLGVTPKSELRTVCFRIPENEYKQLKLLAINRSMTIKGLVESLIIRDIDEKGIMERFETEDSRGKCKSISFQVSNDLFNAIKQRILQTDMSDQDYMRTLIYSETHQEQEENMNEAQSIDMSM